MDIDRQNLQPRKKQPRRDFLCSFSPVSACLFSVRGKQKKPVIYKFSSIVKPFSFCNYTLCYSKERDSTDTINPPTVLFKTSIVLYLDARRNTAKMRPVLKQDYFLQFEIKGLIILVYPVAAFPASLV